MRCSPRRWSALIWSTSLFLFLGIEGCGQPVREDRSINWSNEGQAVGFQHGQEGVFLADKDGGKLKKIFQPGPEVIATSSPLWSAVGRQVIFTTARAAAGPPDVRLSLPGSWQNPAGNILTQRSITYTCWLYEEAEGDSVLLPSAIFEADADHVGYVAANLAVRWHPKGRSLFYVKQVGSRHGLFEYHLDTKRSRQVFPQTSDALIFDWTPDGSQLVCVFGSAKEKEESDGIWIGRPEQEDWWHVPNSGELAQTDLPSVLEQLRATRPAWTADGSRFAFVSYIPGTAQEQAGRHFLQLGTLATRQVEVLAEGREAFRDLHWAPDGTRLAVVRGGEEGSLHIVRPPRPGSETPVWEPEKPVNRRPVRRCAGWNATGDRLAYVVPDKAPMVDKEMWAFLLVPDELARDAVYVADGAGKEPGREVFSGMRVTFPQWSPREDKLSLWVTFSPTYRSWVSLLLGWGLRPGDPAAVFDLKTGQLGWLAVNPHEKVQVGHYYLLKRDYTQARHWYEEAEREMPAPKRATTRDFVEILQDSTGPRDFSFFQYYCLKKLGRKDEARVKLSRFEQLFLPPFAPEQLDGPPAGQNAASGPSVDGNSLEQWLKELLGPESLFGPLVRDLYEAEVFLSIDAAEDGETFFRERLAAAKTDKERLSSALVLAQMLLLEGKHQAYADLATDTIAPLLFKIAKPQPAGKPADLANLQPLVDLVGEFSLLPMFAPDFLAALPKSQLQAIATRWEVLRTKAITDMSRYEVNLVLNAAYLRLGREKERQEIVKLLKGNPVADQVLPSHEDISAGIKRLRADIKAMSRWQR